MRPILIFHNLLLVSVHYLRNFKYRRLICQPEFLKFSHSSLLIKLEVRRCEIDIIITNVTFLYMRLWETSVLRTGPVLVIAKFTCLDTRPLSDVIMGHQGPLNLWPVSTRLHVSNPERQLFLTSVILYVIEG